MFVKWTLIYLAVSIIWGNGPPRVTFCQAMPSRGPFFFPKFVGFRADLKKTRKRSPAGTTRGKDRREKRRAADEPKALCRSCCGGSVGGSCYDGSEAR